MAKRVITEIMKGLSWNNSLAIQGFYSRTFDPDRPLREQVVPLPHKFEDGDSLWFADDDYEDAASAAEPR